MVWYIEESVVSDVSDTIAAFVAPDAVRVVPEGEHIVIPMNATGDMSEVVLECNGEVYTALIGKSLLIALAHVARSDPRFQQMFAVETGSDRPIRLALCVHDHTYMTRAKAENVDIDDGFGPALIVAESCSIVVDDGVSEVFVPVPDSVGFGVVIVPDDASDVAPLSSRSLLDMRLVVHPAQSADQTFDEFLVESFNAARMAILAAMPDVRASFDWDGETGDDIVVDEDEALATLRYTLPLRIPFMFYACAQLERSMMVYADDGRQGTTNIFRALRAAGATGVFLFDNSAYGVFDDGTTVRLIIL